TIADRVGAVRRVPVKPDGTIDALWASAVPAAGRTIEEVHAELLRRYAAAGFPEVEVSVLAIEIAPRRVYVLGEVGVPQGLVVSAPVSTVQAIAAAGGLKERADAGNVVLIRRRATTPRMPDAIVVDVRHILETAGNLTGRTEARATALRQDT